MDELILTSGEEEWNIVEEFDTSDSNTLIQAVWQ